MNKCAYFNNKIYKNNTMWALRMCYILVETVKKHEMLKFEMHK